ncbi:MAG: hypothetical protein IPL40_11440 [Proteobacteria bacterium]|nr:hypothetical protein [Pseudomonadota bacterium]
MRPSLARHLGSFFALVAVVALTTSAHAQGRASSAAAAQDLVEQADAELAEGRLPAAEALYRRALAYAPLEIGFERYSMLLFAQRRFLAGQTLIDAGLRQHPQSEALRAQRGLHLFKLNRVREAYADLSAVVESQRGRFATQAVTAQCCLRMADYPCVRAAVDAYLTARPPKIEGKDYSFRVLRALANLRLGERQTASAELAEVLRAQPQYLPALQAQAELQLRAGAFRAAAFSYERLLPRAPSPELHLMLGQAYLGDGRAALALVQAQQALAAQPKDRESILLEGDALTALGRFEQALVAYRRLAARDAATMYRRNAKLFLRRGQPAEALSEIEAEARMPTAPNEVLALALRAATGAKLVPQAKGYADRLLGRSGITVEMRLQCGRAYGAAGETERAEQVLEAVIAAEAGNLAARRELVRLLVGVAEAARARGALPLALSTLERAQRLQPAAIVVARNLALLQLKTGAAAAALLQLEGVLERVPGDLDANRLAGRVLVAMKRPEAALLRLNAAVAAAGPLGGPALARALADTAAVHCGLRHFDECIAQFDRARELLRGATGDAARLAALTGFVTAQSMRAYLQRAVAAGVAAKARAADVRQAIALAAALPESERTLAQGVAAVVAVLEEPEARRRRGNALGRLRWAQVLRPGYERIGANLMAAYLDYLSGAPSRKLRGAQRLERLARQVNEPERGALLQLAASGHEQYGAALFRAGRFSVARQAYAQSAALAVGEPSLAQQHNRLLADGVGKAPEQVQLALRNLQARLPLADCNLAVLYEERGAAGDQSRAHQLYRSCLRRGGVYPGLRQLVEAQERVRKVLEP